MYPPGAYCTRLQTLETQKAKLKKNAMERVTKVNQYALSKVLGKGAYGEVYKGSAGLGTDPVAVKVLNRSILKRKRVGRNGSAYDSVLREVRHVSPPWVERERGSLPLHRGRWR